VQRAVDEVGAVFDDIDDPYLRERKGDLHDVAGRLRMNLRDDRGGPGDRLQDLETPCVLIADELTPSVVAQLDWTRIPGFRHRRRQPHVSHRPSLRDRSACPAVVGSP
jgi:phosphotransferase system enzyme I (PtsI)